MLDRNSPLHERCWVHTLHSDVNSMFLSNPLPRMGETVAVRLRCRPTDEIRSVHLRRLSGGRRRLVRMRPRPGPFLVFEGEVEVDQPRVTWHFIVETDSELLFFNRRGPGTVPPAEAGDFVLLADLDLPEWIPRTTFYSLMPDRFCRAQGSASGRRAGDRRRDGRETVIRDWEERPLSWDEGRCLDFFNGDLDGIRHRLDHLAVLGVGALSLTPIFPAISYHRYDATSFDQIDPALGGDAGLTALTHALHERDMRILLDVTLNHVGREHAWFRSALDPQAETRSFFHFSAEGEGYTAWADDPAYPKLDYRGPALRDRIYRSRDAVLRRLIASPFSVDGFRFDVGHETANHGRDQLGLEVFRELRQAVKADRPDAYLLGEHPKDAARYLQGDAWDGAMNYFGSARPLRWFAGELDYYQRAIVSNPDDIRPRSGRELAAQIDQAIQGIASPLVYYQYNLLDSHDGPRLHHRAWCTPTLHRALLGLLFLLPGAPSIYYGDEIGIGGGVDAPEDFRWPMPWRREAWNLGTLEVYRRLAGLKRSQPALHGGSYRFLAADDTSVAFCRFSNDAVLIAGVNSAACARDVELDLAPVGDPTDRVLRDVWSGRRWAVEGTRLRVTAEARGGFLIQGELEHDGVH